MEYAIQVLRTLGKDAAYPVETVMVEGNSAHFQRPVVETEWVPFKAVVGRANLFAEQAEWAKTHPDALQIHTDIQLDNSKPVMLMGRRYAILADQPDEFMGSMLYRYILAAEVRRAD